MGVDSREMESSLVAVLVQALNQVAHLTNASLFVIMQNKDDKQRKVRNGIAPTWMRWVKRG